MKNLYKYTSLLAFIFASTECFGSGDLSAIAGKWSIDENSCKNRSTDSSEFLKIRSSGPNESLESSCVATQINVAFPQIKFLNACRSEGEKTISRVTVLITTNNSIVWNEDNQKSINYVRCMADNSAKKTDVPSQSARNSTKTKFDTGSLMLSSHGYSATIDDLSSQNTAFAFMSGTVTKADAEEECNRNSPNGDGLKKNKLNLCVQRTMTETKNRVFLASADCTKMTIIPTFGGEYKIYDIDEYGALKAKNLKNDKDVGDTTASGGPVIDAQFKKLCFNTVSKFKK